MANDVSPAQRAAALTPRLADLVENLVFGDIWERPGLSKRERSLITVAALIALDRNALASHIRRAFDNGLTTDELAEVITHLAFYAGFPCATTASLTLAEIDAERS